MVTHTVVMSSDTHSPAPLLSPGGVLSAASNSSSSTPSDREQLLPQSVVFSRGNQAGFVSDAHEAMSLIEQGLSAFQEGAGYEAVAFYHQAIAADTNNALAHYLLGIVLKSLKQDEDARIEWQTALASYSDGPESEWARERAAMLLSRSA